MASNLNRQEPYPAYRFYVEIDQVVKATFTECSGLESEVALEAYEEGGENRFVHKLAGRVKYADLTLQYGTSDSDELWRWYQQICQGVIEPRNLSVLAYDWLGNILKRWDFQGAYPIKWVGPQFNASQSNIAIESLTLAHGGLQL